MTGKTAIRASTPISELSAEAVATQSIAVPGRPARAIG